MKKTFLLLLTLTTLFFFAACNTKKEKEKESENADPNAATIDSLRQALTQSQNESSDLIETLSQIQDGFDRINEAEGRVSVETRQGEGANKQAIIENMAFIERTMKLNRELIGNLREQLRGAAQSDKRTKAKLEEMVANFTKQLEDKDAEIKALRAELEQKNIQIAEQSEQINNLNDDVNNLNAQNEEGSITRSAR